MAVDGMRIAQLRTQRLNGITQVDFARKCDLHWVTMSNIENGKARVSLATLERIADELGVNRDDLLPRDEDAPLSADDDEEDSEMVPILLSGKHLRKLIREELEAGV